MMREFFWYRIEDEVARPYPDTPEVRAKIDADPRGWYSSVEGCILHGGVKATAFKRRIEKTYDTERFLKTGEIVEAGEVMTTEITASSEVEREWRWSVEFPLGG